VRILWFKLWEVQGKINSYDSSYIFKVWFNVIKTYATNIVYKEYDNEENLIKETTKDIDGARKYFSQNETDYDYWNKYETSVDCQYVIVEKTNNEGNLECTLVNRNDKDKIVKSYISADNKYGCYLLKDTISFTSAD
jgi:hypothetical protein